MSEINTGAAAEQQRSATIKKIYLKDTSFETPNTPQIFTEEFQPEVSVQLQNMATSVTEQLFEVVLSITITTKIKDKTAYLIEVQQAGLFEILGMEEEMLPRFLGTYCPHMLFPYLRQTIDDLLNKGGFPSFLLTPVDFDAIYEEQLQQRQKKVEADTRH